MGIEITDEDTLDLRSRIQEVKSELLIPQSNMAILTLETGTRISEYQMEITIHGTTQLDWMRPGAPIRVLIMPGEEE